MAPHTVAHYPPQVVALLTHCFEAHGLISLLPTWTEIRLLKVCEARSQLHTRTACLLKHLALFGGKKARDQTTAMGRLHPDKDTPDPAKFSCLV